MKSDRQLLIFTSENSIQYQTMATTDNKDQEPKFGSNFETPDIQELYTNGFQVGLSNADVVITFKRNNRDTQIVNMSFTLAKTLSQMLGGLVDRIETVGDFKIKTTKELDFALSEDAKRQTEAATKEKVSKKRATHKKTARKKAAPKIRKLN